MDVYLICCLAEKKIKEKQTTIKWSYSKPKTSLLLQQHSVKWSCNDISAFVRMQYRMDIAKYIAESTVLHFPYADDIGLEMDVYSFRKVCDRFDSLSTTTATKTERIRMKTATSMRYHEKQNLFSLLNWLYGMMGIMKTTKAKRAQIVHSQHKHQHRNMGEVKRSKCSETLLPHCNRK